MQQRPVEPLQGLFAAAILTQPELPPDPTDDRVYDLNPLREPGFEFVYDSGSGIQDVAAVTRVSLVGLVRARPSRSEHSTAPSGKVGESHPARLVYDAVPSEDALTVSCPHSTYAYRREVSHALVGVDRPRSDHPHLRDHRIDRFLSRVLCRRCGHRGSAGLAGGEPARFRAVAPLRLAVDRHPRSLPGSPAEEDQDARARGGQSRAGDRVATEVIAVGATGQAELRGSTWQARNIDTVDLKAGDRCRVDRVDGLVLSIRKAL